MKRKLPKQVARIAEDHFLKAFKEEGFTDKSYDPWQARARKTRADRRTGRRRAILVQSGALRRSIRVGRATWNRIEVGSYGIPYAKYHNQGEGKLPVRKFVGPSYRMREKIRAKIRQELKSAIQ